MGRTVRAPRHSSELVLLPEFTMVDPVWQDELFDAARQASAQAPTTLDAPFATVNIDLSAPAAARDGYPCSVLSGRSRG